MRIPIEPIRSELEYAPALKEEFIRVVGAYGCDMSRNCRYQNRFTDTHHLIYAEHRDDLSDGEILIRDEARFVLNGISRCLHDGVHARWKRSEPLSDDFIRGYFHAYQESMSAKQVRRLKQWEKTVYG